MSNPEEMVAYAEDGHVADVEKSVAELLNAPPVKVTIDGKEISIKRATLGKDPITGADVARPTTIYDAAAKVGVKIPILCHREHMAPVAVCRFCVVDVKGQYRLAAACHRQVEDNMVVSTAATSERVRGAVKVLTELLLVDNAVPRSANREYADNELRTIAKQIGLNPKGPNNGSRFPKSNREKGQDESSLVIAVDHNACILCDRCIRACNEIRHNEVIGRAGKGFAAHIAFDLENPMGESSCVSCGECMVSCPTGALTNIRTSDIKPWKDVKPAPQPVEVNDLMSHPLFAGVSRAFMDWNKGSVVRRKFRKGDIICREGEFGSSAFIIEKGRLDVFLTSPMKHVRSRQKAGAGVFGLFKRFSSLVSRADDKREEEEASSRFIHIDAPVSLKYSEPIAELGPEHIIFGEMTCMNSYPRSATVRAREDCSLLEIQRNVLYILQRNKQSKDLLDKVYRERSIHGHLRSVQFVAGVLQDEEEFERFVDLVQKKADLIRLNPGDVIFRQGDPADNFYLVRIGFVKVAQRQPGGEHVLNYVGPGGYVGEIGLMTFLPEIQKLAPPGLRTATCSALDHVDLVRIKGEDFRHLLDEFPAIKERLLRTAVHRLEENETICEKADRVPLGEFLKQGLQEAQSLLVLDLEKCTRCDECTKACADAHDGVTRLVREGLRFDKFLVASSCRSCLDPYCMVGCPVGSIRRRNTREIIIEDWCIGCGKCAENCPYGNINMHPFPTGKKGPDPDNPDRQIPIVQQKATMCDLCTDLDGQPSCVYACPHDAAHRMRGVDLIKLVEEKMGK